MAKFHHLTNWRSLFINRAAALSFNQIIYARDQNNRVREPENLAFDINNQLGNPYLWCHFITQSQQQMAILYVRNVTL